MYVELVDSLFTKTCMLETLEVLCLKVQIPHDGPFDCRILQWDGNMRHYKGAPKRTFC